MQETGIGGDKLTLAYAEHSRPLLKLAALLVPDVGAAREVVYESFAALYRELSGEQRRIRGRDDVLAFLLRDVVCRARTVVTRNGRVAARDLDGGEAGGEAEVILAMRALPDGQREALVLRYYGQLSDEQAAAALGVRPSALRANVARGMAALRAVLEPRVLAR